LKVLVPVKRVVDFIVKVRVKPDALGVDVTPRLKTLKVQEPPSRKAGVKVADVKELVEKLRNEARII
jgi:electron transfer flavoprotein beta subunit